MKLSIFRILGAVLLCLLVSGCGYNTIPTDEEQAKAKWSDVQNNYQRRTDLIPNLVATVQGYAKQEKDVLTAVTEARAKATSIHVDAADLTDPDDAIIMPGSMTSNTATLSAAIRLIASPLRANRPDSARGHA